MAYPAFEVITHFLCHLGFEVSATEK